MRGGPYDVAIVGGGINGAGIAADAAGRGLKVVLFEKDDLASGTSSASSKLIHGGLRYLEHWEFRLVREALAEREVLLSRAPHIIRPLRFIIPHAPGMRPRVLLRLGLWLYDHLAARRRIPRSGSVRLSDDPVGRPLRTEFSAGFSYYDCWVDDARLVAITALDAAERGADIHTSTPVTHVAQRGDLWEIKAGPPAAPVTVAARALVNAAGPWCAAVARLASAAGETPTLRLVRGTHIVVPRIAGADDAYLLQNDDGRVVFALPFEQRFTLIGTTEVGVASPADGFVPSDEEEQYLLAAARRFFSQSPNQNDVVWRFAGVRPLDEDGAANTGAVSRDYRLDLVQPHGGPPLLNIIGGKITTFRCLAEAALARLGGAFPALGPAWTASTALPGGETGAAAFEDWREDFLRRHSGIARTTLLRLTGLYGTRSECIVGDALSNADLGEAIGGGLTEREVVYLRDHEWARTPDDVLWRRTKAGLHLSEAERGRAETALVRLLAR